MRAHLIYISMFLICCTSLCAQDSYLLVRVIPDNYNTKLDYEMPNRFVYGKDSLSIIQCFKIQIDTISKIKFDKLNKINQSISNDSLSVNYRVLFPLYQNNVPSKFRIEEFDLYNPWGFSQVETSLDSCMTSNMIQIIGMYEKPSTELSYIDFDFLIISSSDNKEFRLSSQIKIE